MGDKGNTKYQIKGCAGSGGFAQVYKAFVDCNPEEVVALKVTIIHLFLEMAKLEKQWSEKRTSCVLCQSHIIRSSKKFLLK